MLAFNVDADFSDVVDGLVMIDLSRLTRPLLDRYLGKAGADHFLDFHATKSATLFDSFS